MEHRCLNLEKSGKERIRVKVAGNLLKNTGICSKHFVDEDIIREATK
jgi:hypothetical protein